MRGLLGEQGSREYVGHMIHALARATLAVLGIRAQIAGRDEVRRIAGRPSSRNRRAWVGSGDTGNMEQWIVCDKDHVHWGAAGGAGLLFRYVPEHGEPLYLLQRRSQSVDYGATWGMPGGAIRTGETPEMAARREVQEELGLLPPYRIAGREVQDCGGNWRFHIILADVDHDFPAFCARETQATGWFTRQEMQSLVLHPGLKSWLDQEESKVTK